MRIAVLGTGSVGRTLSAAIAALSHDVTMGTRDVETAMARPGDPPLATWLGTQPRVRLAIFAEAASGAEMVVNATSGSVSLAALQAAGRANLAGKVLLDVANPLDFSHGFPPTLLVKDTDSLGEQIQVAFPEARVVKSLNTMHAPMMVRPRELAKGDHSVFVSGNDGAAKKVVADLLESFGHTDIIDLGDISTARGTEMLLPLWLRLYGALGTFEFNFKVVR